MYYTKSDHYVGGRFAHTLNSGWVNTRRSAAVCWGESLPLSALGWFVMGYHWENINGRLYELLGSPTIASNCNIYTGWWETQP